MDFLGTLVLVVAAVIILILFLASRKPDIFRVERRLTVKAPAKRVFSQINDLHAWQAWSPWAKKDPAAKNDFSGPQAGVGASLAWEGNGQVGKGRMTIVESAPDIHVSYRLEFEKPFRATNFAEFALHEAQGETLIVWTMHGPAPLISKIMDLLMNMDRMIGRDFESGLESLRMIVEAPDKA